jgi:hypothetical protein
MTRLLAAVLTGLSGGSQVNDDEFTIGLKAVEFGRHGSRTTFQTAWLILRIDYSGSISRHATP